MDTIRIKELIKQLAKRDYQNMYLDDFLLTWEKSDDEVHATFLVAEILCGGALEHERHVALNAHHEIVEVMGNTTGKPAYCFHFLTLYKTLFKAFALCQFITDTRQQRAPQRRQMIEVCGDAGCCDLRREARGATGDPRETPAADGGSRSGRRVVRRREERLRDPRGA